MKARKTRQNELIMATKLFSPLIIRLRRRLEHVDDRLTENYTRLELQDTSEILVENTGFTQSGDSSELTAETNNVSTVITRTGSDNNLGQDENGVTEVIVDETNHSKAKKFAVLGISLAIVASLFISTTSLMIKLAESIPSLEVGFMRFALQLVFSIPLVIFFNDKLNHPWKKIRFVLLRGTVQATAINLGIYAVKHMPLADARVILFTAPVFTALLGRIFLKESISKFDLIAMLLSFGGVVLIARPTFLFGSLAKSSSSQQQVWFPTLLAVLGACCQACNIVVTRKVSREMPGRVVVLYSTIVGTVITLLAALISGGFKYPDCGTHDALYVIAAGVLGYSGQLIITKALSLEKAFIVSLVRTIGIAFSFVFQLTVLGVAPNGLSIGGAFLVLLCNISIFIKKYLAQKNNVNH